MNEDIKRAKEVLETGGIILYPTDTIWGIGCDATNKKAVRRVFDIKKRKDSKSLIVLIDSMAKLCSYVEEIPDMAWGLIEISTKPLTIVYDGARNLAQNLIAEDGSVGIRITNENFSRKLCERFRKPIVSTSANVSGEMSPLCFLEINEDIINAVDYVVAYGREDKAQCVASSIVKLSKGNLIKILRE